VEAVRAVVAVVEAVDGDTVAVQGDQVGKAGVAAAAGGHNHSPSDHKETLQAFQVYNVEEVVGGKPDQNPFLRGIRQSHV
jgi:hypothetical protein